MKYKQKLPKKVEAALDAYVERIKAIKWFRPDPSLKRAAVDTKVQAALKAFGVEASIEYRSLKTPADYDAAWDAAWGAADMLATFTDTYKKDTPFVKLMDIWELGMYPVGVVGGKFVVYTPIDFESPAPENTLQVIINGIKYVPEQSVLKEKQL